MAERWLPVRRSLMYRVPAGVFEGSSLGNVRVLGEPAAPEPDKDGYLRLRFRGRWFYVHILVALAFKGEPQVRHLGERTDNRPAKLAWGSKWRNEQDKREDGMGGTVPSAPETHGTADHL